MNQNKTESKWEEEFLGLRRRGKLETGDKLIDFISRIEQEAREEERKMHDNDLQILQDFVSHKIKSFSTTESYASVVESIYKYITDLRIRNIK